MAANKKGNSVVAYLEQFHNVLRTKHDAIAVTDIEMLRSHFIDQLVRDVHFHADPGVRKMAEMIIRAAAEAHGAIPASIQGLYGYLGEKGHHGFTVPAINIRTMTYDVARAILRVIKRQQAPALIFELARSEMGYTDQPPAVFAATIQAAAVAEAYRGPLFIQCDHFQFKPSAYALDPEHERQSIQRLIEEAVGAGMFNVDIDASTLVDLDQPTLAEQQRLNIEETWRMTDYIRRIEPAGISISIGGEVGEVGKNNTTVEELRAFLDGYMARRRTGNYRLTPISKVSVQTGTRHGGIPQADGSAGSMNVDFPTIEQLSLEAQTKYGLAGVVQHGASTLPLGMFHLFPKRRTVEIHLSTGFQNIILDHPSFPTDLRQTMMDACRTLHSQERQTDWTDQQFFYKTRKHVLGQFKHDLWNLPVAIRTEIIASLEQQVDQLVTALNTANTAGLVATTVKPIHVPQPVPTEIEAVLKSFATN